MDCDLMDHEPAAFDKSLSCHTIQQKLDFALNKMTAKIRITAMQKAKALNMLRQNRDVFSLPGDKPTFTNELTISINTGTAKPKYTTDDPDNWECYLPYAVFPCNTMPHTATRHSPFSLLRGYELRITFDYDCAPRLTLPLNYDAYQHILTQAQLKMHEKIKANLDVAAAVSKEYFDRKARTRDFAVNDLVLLTNTRKVNKIQPDFIGPFIIMDASPAAKNVVTIDSLDVPGHKLFPQLD
uniref:Uncharacterized protein n=1 Tax=Romanomermis culicivorax TaxID=13658 RepID=A0A915JLI3_ROMCU